MKDLINSKLLSDIISRNGGLYYVSSISKISIKTIKNILADNYKYKLTSLINLTNALQINLKDILY